MEPESSDVGLCFHEKEIHKPATNGSEAGLRKESTDHIEHLLDLNHQNYSILYNNLRFHNHTPHFLGSTYLLDSSTEHLDAIYNDAVYRDNLEPWQSSPGGITPSNFRQYIGRKEYQRAWVDFFEQQLQAGDHGSGWQNVGIDFLLNDSQTLLHGLFADVGHPLIHLGYALELDSPVLASEALGLAATCYDRQLSGLLTTTVSQSSQPTGDLFQIFSNVSNDSRLPTFDYPGDDNLPFILTDQNHLATIVSYLHSWTITNPVAQLGAARRLAALVLISTSPHLGGHGYDFFLVHILTTIHAVGVFTPHLPAQHHATVLKLWLAVALLVYTAQNRRRLDPAYITGYDLQGHDWQYVRKQALEGPHASDAHFVKACRAWIVAGEGESDDDEWYLKCAVRFATEFEGWGGFRLDGPEAEEVCRHREKDGIHVMKVRGT